MIVGLADAVNNISVAGGGQPVRPLDSAQEQRVSNTHGLLSSAFMRLLHLSFAKTHASVLYIFYVYDT